MKYLLIIISFNLHAFYPFDDNGDVEVAFSEAIAFVESSFIKDARSHVNAYGYYQITPIACKDAKIDCGKDHKPSFETQLQVMNHFVKKWFKKTGCIYKTMYIYNNGRGNFIKNQHLDFEKEFYVNKIIAYLKASQTRPYDFYKDIKGFKRTKTGAKIIWRSNNAT